MEMTKAVNMAEFREWYLKYTESNDDKNFEEVSELLEEYKKYKENEKLQG